LPRGAFHNAMKAARHETQTRSAAGQIYGAPMAYFLATLRTTASDQCGRLAPKRSSEWARTRSRDAWSN
jgi:hypothetical protein